MEERTMSQGCRRHMTLVRYEDIPKTYDQLLAVHPPYHEAVIAFCVEQHRFAGGMPR